MTGVFTKSNSQKYFLAVREEILTFSKKYSYFLFRTPYTGLVLNNNLQLSLSPEKVDPMLAWISTSFVTHF